MGFSRDELEDVYQKVGRAIEEAVVKSVADRLSDRSYDFMKAESFLMSCYNESDRAAPVLVFSFIENAIRELFSLELEVDSDKELDSIFGPFGPLATTSSRIRILSVLGWISKNTAKSLDILRRIRNQFAHDPPAEAFRDSRIESLLGSLPHFETHLFDTEYLRSIGIEVTELPRNDSKTIFLARAAFVFSILFVELSTFPSCRRAGLPANSILVRRELHPEVVSRATILGAKVAFHAVYPITE